MAFARPRIDLLTSAIPQLDTARLLKRFAKSIRPVLDSLGIPTQLRFKEDADALRVTLGQHQVQIRTLGHSYWGEEDQDDIPEENDLWEYGPRASWMEHDALPGADGLEEAVMDSKGAIIIESVETPDPQMIMPVIAHLAAAAMTDTVAMIVPTSGAIHPANETLRDQLRQTRDIMTVLQYVVRTEITPVEGENLFTRIVGPGDEFWYIVYGLHPFARPDVGLRFPIKEDDQGPMEAAAAAVQSFVAYMLDRGDPVPVGDTLTVGDGGSYRVAEGQFPSYQHSTCGQIELVPM